MPGAHTKQRTSIEVLNKQKRPNVVGIPYGSWDCHQKAQCKPAL